MNNPSFGVNLGGIAPWSSNQPFLDYFKQSEWYIFNPKKDWFTRKNDSQLDLDHQCWLRSLPTVQGKTLPVMAAVLWNKWHPINFNSEGMSLRGISRQTKLAYDTVVAIIRDASQKAQMVHNDVLNDVETNEIDGDEMWSFVQKNRKTAH